MSCGFELHRQFVWCPQIVVVKKRDPISSRLGSAAVAGGADSQRAFVANHPNPRIAEAGNDGRRVVTGCLIHHDHFQIDVPLHHHAAKRESQKGAAIARRNDDGYVHYGG